MRAVLAGRRAGPGHYAWVNAAQATKTTHRAGRRR